MIYYNSNEDKVRESSQLANYFNHSLSSIVHKLISARKLPEGIIKTSPVQLPQSFNHFRGKVINLSCRVVKIYVYNYHSYDDSSGDKRTETILFFHLSLSGKVFDLDILGEDSRSRK